MKDLLEPGPEALLRIAGAISDDTPTDWEAEKLRHPGLSDSLERLRLVESLVRAAHAPPPESQAGLDASRSPTVALGPQAPVHRDPATIAPARFTWGPLAVHEQLGEGTYGKVYRAHDPTLDCDVALKLWNPEAGRTWDELLAEARRLARVRHDNVVVVHGADCFDGRAGMWTELLRGETLERRLVRHGCFGFREAAAIGVELCRALCAIHSAGLVHRDVKTQNVMRTEQGRYVLMDFGCVGEVEAGGRLGRTAHMHGTPAAMAPEQLVGDPIGPSADLYALGVVLYRLVTGAYPIEAKTYGELVIRHREHRSTPILDRRPDLPASFVHVVETAMAAEPAKRFASAGAMEQALHEVLADAPGADGRVVVPSPPRPGPGHWWSGGAFPLAAAAAAVLVVAWFWAVRPRPEPPPPAPVVDTTTTNKVANPPVTPAEPVAFEVGVSLHRSTPDGDERLVAGALVRPGDALFLEIRGSSPLYVYAFNADAAGESYVLFPAPGLDTANPLAPGEEHRLPGTAGGLEASWQVTSAGGRERVLVVASRKPIAELEAEIAKLPKPEKGAPVVYPRASETTVARLRGMGGLLTGPVAGRHFKSPGLGAIEHAIPAGPATMPDPFVWQIELENPAK